jgi:hypothetical protein
MSGQTSAKPVGYATGFPNSHADEVMGVSTESRENRKSRLALIAATAALGLATLGPVLFLNADKAQSAPVLTNDPRSLDTLGEAAKKLIKRF